MSYSKFSYDEHARKFAADDFLRQSARTVNGQPVPQDQIALIIMQIKSNLPLAKGDILLDLACGNGSLSNLLFDNCGGYLGVDRSEYLISVAKRYFEKCPSYEFVHEDVLPYLKQENKPERFTKMLCYAGIQYFSDLELIDLLSAVKTRFLNVTTIFLGNVPDRSSHTSFYKDRGPTEDELNAPDSAIGIWRSPEHLREIAHNAGWTAEMRKMPSDFYASSYRYDAVLTR